MSFSSCFWMCEIINWMHQGKGVHKLWFCTKFSGTTTFLSWKGQCGLQTNGMVLKKSLKCPAEVQCWGLLFLSYEYKQNIMPGCAAFSGTDETGISLCGYKNLSNDCWTCISDKNVKRHYIKVFVQDLLFTLSQPTYLYEEWICNHKYFHVPLSSCDHLSYCKK